MVVDKAKAEAAFDKIGNDLVDALIAHPKRRAAGLDVTPENRAAITEDIKKAGMKLMEADPAGFAKKSAKEQAEAIAAEMQSNPDDYRRSAAAIEQISHTAKGLAKSLSTPKDIERQMKVVAAEELAKQLEKNKAELGKAVPPPQAEVQPPQPGVPEPQVAQQKPKEKEPPKANVAPRQQQAADPLQQAIETIAGVMNGLGLGDVLKEAVAAVSFVTGIKIDTTQRANAVDFGAQNMNNAPEAVQQAGQQAQQNNANGQGQGR